MPPPKSKSIPAIIDITYDRVAQISDALNIVLSVVEADAEYMQYSFNFTGTDVRWLKLQGYENTSYIPIGTSDVTPVLQNLDQLTGNFYTATIHFELSNGTAYLGSFQTTINLTLTGTPANQITTDKAVYSLVYNRSDNSLTGDALVSIINNTAPVSLKLWQNANIFAPAQNFTDSFILTEDAGNPLSANPILPATGIVNIPAKIEKLTGEFVKGFSIQITVIDGGISVAPAEVNFEIFKAPGNEHSAVLAVTNPVNVPFTVSGAPAWLVLDSNSGSTAKNITVTTNTPGLALGSYAAVLKFEYGTKFIDVPVKLELRSFIEIDASAGFCLDIPEVAINRKNENGKFVRITVTADYHVEGVTTRLEKVYAQPYFLDKASFGLGEKLHRHFPRIKKHFFDTESANLLSKIEASVKVEELDADRNPVFERSVSGILLFPGKKPVGFPFFTNFMHRKINSKAVILSALADDSSVTLTKILEENLIRPLVSDLAVINFYNFPRVYNPVHLQWENQNLVPEWFTFTGDYTISADFNHVYARNIFNAQNEKFDLTKVKLLSIDSGLIMAQERPLIEEMIDSKLSFIKIRNKVYRCFNITKKATLESSKEELLSNDLEYLIVE